MTCVTLDSELYQIIAVQARVEAFRSDYTWECIFSVLEPFHARYRITHISESWQIYQ